MDKRQTIKELKKFKEKLSEEIPVDKMLFFGSRAKGRSKRNSDIDLIIVSNKFNRKKFRNRSLGFYRYWSIKLPVDFLCYTPSEFRQRAKQVSIVKEAIKEGIEI